MQPDKPPARWRDFLTPDERQRLAEIEAHIATVKHLLTERDRMARRADQRARYRAAKGA